MARRRGGLPADAPLRLFPRVSPLEQLRPHDSSEDRAAALPAGMLSGLVAALTGNSGAGGALGAGGLAGPGGAGGPAGQLAAQLAWPPAGSLMMPGYWRVG